MEIRIINTNYCILVKFENLCTVNRICEEYGEEEKVAVKNANKANQKIEELEKELEKAKRDGKDAHKEAENKKVLRRKAQKRSFFLTKAAMKEDECDIGKNSRAFVWR